MGGGGVKGMNHFLVHFNVHIPLQIVFVNNFETVGPFQKWNPAPRRVPKIGKKH